MKRIRVEIEWEVPEDTTEADVSQILADAVGEFHSHRYPPREYVERRYPHPEYSWCNHDEKVAQVTRRLSIVDAMRSLGRRNWKFTDLGRVCPNDGELMGGVYPGHMQCLKCGLVL